MKVLIAEDDPVLRNLLEATLVRWEYHVVIACDGEEALLTLQSEDAPQLAILDWMMPGMDGSEVCRKVRHEAKAPPAYIILLTAHEWKDMETGADDYLFKPFKISELRARLHAGKRAIEIQNECFDAIADGATTRKHGIGRSRPSSTRSTATVPQDTSKPRIARSHRAEKWSGRER